MDPKLNIFAVIAKRMDWLAQRQHVIADNIANADTPNYAPRDLKESQFLSLLKRRIGPIDPVATHGSHLRGTALREGPARSERQNETYETSPAGNAVVLEEQLIKVAKVQGDYQTMTNLYRKHMDMFRTHCAAAADRPDRHGYAQGQAQGYGMTDLLKSLDVSASGMKAQGTRLRVISENVANAGSTATSPDGEPYRRKLVTFGSVLDRQLGVEKVDVKRISRDPGEFGQKYQPNHPAADATGYVKTANVNSMIEMADMREAQRSYEANMRVLQASRSMLQRTIDLLR